MRDESEKVCWATRLSFYGAKGLPSDAPYWADFLVPETTLSKCPPTVHFFAVESYNRNHVDGSEGSVRLRNQGDMVDGGRMDSSSNLRRRGDLQLLEDVDVATSWTSVRFGPPASRRESPAPRSGARNLEVGGSGGTGRRQRRPPAGAGQRRRAVAGRSRSRSRSRAISCTYGKVTVRRVGRFYPVCSTACECARMGEIPVSPKLAENWENWGVTVSRGSDTGRPPTIYKERPPHGGPSRRLI